ncbi:MAG: DUF3857 domain-containing protein [Acidobacteriia bacterium]|nr:DUF3857 domain-containing protein [Terriglobia bacterium]
MLGSLRKPYVCLLFSLAISVYAPGQESAKSVKADKDFSGEAYVVEEMTSGWSFENDGTGSRDVSVRIRIQSDVALQTFGVLTIGYQKAAETVAVDYVRVRHANGSVVETPLGDVEDMPAAITREAPFYSDLREKHVPVKGLGIGDVLEYKCHWIQAKPLVPGQFWVSMDFSKDEIVLKQTAQISVPRARAVKLSSELPPTVKDDGARRVYTWTRSNLVKSQQPKIELAQLTITGKLPAPDIQLSTFQSWQEVARWYGGLQQDRVAPSPEIRQKAAELTAHSADDNAKLRAIYEYVSSEFRYIGVAFGIGRYQPHFAAEVLANQYGDCKDKHTLLASLLAAAGIPSYPALISSSRLMAMDVPSPAQFDHIITAVPRGQDILWLDTTAEVAPLGYLLLPLRGKDALIIYENPAFQKTALDPPFPTSWTFKMDSKLDDKGTLTGKVEESLRGDLEFQFRTALRRLPRDKWKDLIQQISYATGFAGKVSDVTVDRLDPAAPVRLSYTYEREDFPDWKNRRIVVPAPSALGVPAEEDGKLPRFFWLGTPGEFVFDSKVELPKGFTASIPSEKNIKEDFIEYHATYSFSGSVLSGHYRILLKQREISGPAVAAYKEFTKKVAEDRDQYVELSSSTARNAQVAVGTLQRRVWELPDSTDPKAMEAENQAKEALQRGQMEEGIRDYRRAVAADPKFTRGWIVLGQMYLATLQKDAGIEALRGAVRSNPQQVISYKVLAFALTSSGRRDEAIGVWQDLAKVAPDDHDAPTNLGNLFISQKKYKDAIPYLEKSTKLFPDQPISFANLAIAYLHTGEEEKAVALFDQVLKLGAGPVPLNNVAYMLTNENKRLDLALKYAQQAVHEEEEDSSKVKLATMSAADLVHTSNLSAYWDTLGWVYFRTGDLKQAETYLRAAWSVLQDPVIGNHLGQAYEAQHRRQDAIHIYRLAASITPALGQGSEATEAVASSNERLHALGAPAQKAGARAPFPGEELSKERTVLLPRLGSLSGVAEAFVLLGPGPKVEDIKFISGSQQMRDAGKALAEAKFNAVFPANSSGRVVRRGILACYPHSGCSFALIPVEAVRSVE